MSVTEFAHGSDTENLPKPSLFEGPVAELGAIEFETAVTSLRKSDEC
jgi:hypothetical protein